MFVEYFPNGLKQTTELQKIIIALLITKFVVTIYWMRNGTKRMYWSKWINDDFLHDFMLVCFLHGERAEDIFNKSNVLGNLIYLLRNILCEL